MTQAGSDFAALFGFGKLPLVTVETLYYLRSYGPLFAAACVGATPLPKQMGHRLAQMRFGQTAELLFLAALLLICTGYLVDGSFSPFLYFRF